MTEPRKVGRPAGERRRQWDIRFTQAEQAAVEAAARNERQPARLWARNILLAAAEAAAKIDPKLVPPAY